MGERSGGNPVIASIADDAAGIRVTHQPDRHLLRVTIDNTPGNRLGLAQIERLRDVAARLGAMDAAADECRAVVLDAAGPDFSHGANLTDPALMARLNEGRDARESFAACGQALVSCWRAIPVPTLAVATGHVVGAGACLFMASDFRVAARGTVVRFPEVDRGMHLGWGIVPRLASLLGEPRALRLALLGEALGVDVLADVVAVTDDPAGEGQALAERLAGKPPLAARAILDVLRQSMHRGDSAAETDAQRWADTLESADFAEAIAAWFGRRPGNWKGR